MEGGGSGSSSGVAALLLFSGRGPGIGGSEDPMFGCRGSEVRRFGRGFWLRGFEAPSLKCPGGGLFSLTQKGREGEDSRVPRF